MSQSDLRRTAIQYLRGLQHDGITDLPAETERVLATLIVDHNAPGEPQSATENDVVAESTGNYHADPERSLGETGQALAGSSTVLVGTGSSSAYSRKLDEAGRIDALQTLSLQVSGCTKCEELGKCRTQTVFGVGNPMPRLAFFGEGPGADEDRLGEPFVGRAGELLNKIIAACKMSREDVYIFNSVKCRPPGNRNPHEVEIENCWDYAARQLEILQPEFICCLGSVAARTLLRTKESVGRMRGKFHQYLGSQVVVTYHPAYLLRTPAAKAKTWDDMKMLMGAMGIEL